MSAHPTPITVTPKRRVQTRLAALRVRASPVTQALELHARMSTNAQATPTTVTLTRRARTRLAALLVHANQVTQAPERRAPT
jgi:hypothetical protein